MQTRLGQERERRAFDQGTSHGLGSATPLMQRPVIFLALLAGVQSSVCVLSGSTGSGTIASTECWNETTRKWVYGAPLINPRSNFAVVDLGAITCALMGNPLTADTVECLNSTNKWHTLSSVAPSVLGLQSARYGLIYGNGYIAGIFGFNSQTSFQATTNGSTLGGWQTVNYTFPQRLDPAVIVLNGTSCVVGGGATSITYNDSVCLTGFPLKINQYVFGPNLPVPRQGGTVISLQDRQCIVGGSDKEATDTYLHDTVCILSNSSLTDGVFVSESRLTFPYDISQSANITLDGMSCLAGGGNTTASSAVWCVNESNGNLIWVRYPDLLVPRKAHASFHDGNFTLSPTRAPTTAPPTLSPTLSPTSSPTFNPTTLRPSAAPTLTPSSSPTTSNPTAAPTPSPVTLTPSTLAPSTLAPSTSAPSAAVTTSEVSLVFTLDTPPTNQSKQAAQQLAQSYLTTLLVYLNFTTPEQQEQVQVKDAYFTPQGQLLVVLTVAGTVTKEVTSTDGRTIAGATVHVQWPSVFEFVSKLPTWVPILIGLLILALVGGTMLLSSRINPKAKSSSLFGFMANFFSLLMQMWAAYSLHFIQSQDPVLRKYFISYIVFLLAPILPNSIAIWMMLRLFLKSKASREWYHLRGNRWMVRAMIAFSAPTNTRLLSMLYSGSFGLSGFRAPAEEIFQRLVRSSGVIGITFGEVPRATIQILVIITAQQDSGAFVSVVLPLIFSILILFYTTMQTCYHVAYAEKDIVELSRSPTKISRATIPRNTLPK